MPLTIHEVQVIGLSRVSEFRVGGLPSGQEAFIAEFPTNGWKVLRSVDGVQGNWTGTFPSADEALRYLQLLIAVEN